MVSVSATPEDNGNDHMMLAAACQADRILTDHATSKENKNEVINKVKYAVALKRPKTYYTVLHHRPCSSKIERQKQNRLERLERAEGLTKSQQKAQSKQIADNNKIAVAEAAGITVEELKQQRRDLARLNRSAAQKRRQENRDQVEYSKASLQTRAAIKRLDLGTQARQLVQNIQGLGDALGGMVIDGENKALQELQSNAETEKQENDDFRSTVENSSAETDQARSNNGKIFHNQFHPAKDKDAQGMQGTVFENGQDKKGLTVTSYIPCVRVNKPRRKTRRAAARLNANIGYSYASRTMQAPYLEDFKAQEPVERAAEAARYNISRGHPNPYIVAHPAHFAHQGRQDSRPHERAESLASDNVIAISSPQGLIRTHLHTSHAHTAEENTCMGMGINPAPAFMRKPVMLDETLRYSEQMQGMPVHDMLMDERMTLANKEADERMVLIDKAEDESRET